MSFNESSVKVEAKEEHYFYADVQPVPVEVTYRLRLLAGNANPGLAQSVAQILKMDLVKVDVKTFANGESSIKIAENLRGDDVYIIQPTCAGPKVDLNTAMMELLLLIHTLKLSSVRRITAVVPYYAYSRQDRKTQSRVPISASAVAQLMQSMGVDRVLTLDLHCGQIQGFFRNIPLDNMLMFPEFATYLAHQPWFVPEETVIVSPDAGGVERANVLADAIGAHHIVTILKRRVEAGKVDSMQTVGDVKGFTCIIVDDMVDTAGTLCKACELLAAMGAKKVVACATHGILTDPAPQRINDCAALTELVVSDSIPHDNIDCPKLTVLSIAPLIAQAVSRLHSEQSLSSLFNVNLRNHPVIRRSGSFVATPTPDDVVVEKQQALPAAVASSSSSATA